MPAITLEQAQAQLDAWLQASLVVAQNQSYTIQDRQFTKADAGEIRRQIDYWESKVNQLSSGSSGPRLRYVVTG